MTFFYYFAYGSNLLKQRIRIQNKGSQFECIGILRGFKLTFVAESKRWKGALATIIEDPKSEIWGCVWRVPQEFAGELDKQEYMYHRIQVPIETEQGIIDCRTYQFDDLAAEEKNPSPHYKTVILAGAVEHDLPDGYIKKLYAIPDNGFKGKVEVDLDVIRTFNEDISNQ